MASNLGKKKKVCVMIAIIVIAFVTGMFVQQTIMLSSGNYVWNSGKGTLFGIQASCNGQPAEGAFSTIYPLSHYNETDLHNLIIEPVLNAMRACK